MDNQLVIEAAQRSYSCCNIEQFQDANHFTTHLVNFHFVPSVNYRNRPIYHCTACPNAERNPRGYQRIETFRQHMIDQHPRLYLPISPRPSLVQRAIERFDLNLAEQMQVEQPRPNMLIDENRDILLDNEMVVEHEIEIPNDDIYFDDNDNYGQPEQLEQPDNFDDNIDAETISEVDENDRFDEDDIDFNLLYEAEDFQNETDFILRSARFANFVKSKVPAASKHVRTSMVWAIEIAKIILQNSNEPLRFLNLCQKAFKSEYYQKRASNVENNMQVHEIEQNDNSMAKFYYIPIEQTLQNVFRLHPIILNEINRDHLCMYKLIFFNLLYFNKSNLIDSLN